MRQSTENKLENVPIISWIVKLLKRINLPGLQGFSFYDLLELYVIGIFKGALTTRAMQMILLHILLYLVAMGT